MWQRADLYRHVSAKEAFEKAGSKDKDKVVAALEETNTWSQLEVS